MAYSIVNKLLHSPTVRLKEYACGGDGQLYGKMLEDLFDLSHLHQDARQLEESRS